MFAIEYRFPLRAMLFVTSYRPDSFRVVSEAGQRFMLLGSNVRIVPMLWIQHRTTQ